MKVCMKMCLKIGMAEGMVGLVGVVGVVGAILSLNQILVVKLSQKPDILVRLKVKSCLTTKKTVRREKVVLSPVA